jgi:hypothetical protein
MKYSGIDLHRTIVSAGAIRTLREEGSARVQSGQVEGLPRYGAHGAAQCG